MSKGVSVTSFTSLFSRMKDVFPSVNCLNIYLCLWIPDANKVKWPVINTTRKKLEGVGE